MITTTVIKEVEEVKVLGFPRLMEGTESSVVVLFTESKKGVVVSVGASADEIGWYHSNWQMEYFKDFKGELTLKNKQ